MPIVRATSIDSTRSGHHAGSPCTGNVASGKCQSPMRQWAHGCFRVILALFMLLLGAVSGAAARYFVLRKNSRRRGGGFRRRFVAAFRGQRPVRCRRRRAEAPVGPEPGAGQSRSQDGSVLRALAPVAEKLTAVQQQVSLLERDRLEQYGQLAQQLQEARLSDEQLIRSTHALESALRSNSARGQWGEVQLRRVVEAAGMLRHVDFHRAGPQHRRRVVRPPGPGGPAPRREAAGGRRQGPPVRLP
jgi:DNA recombination protein RmuC